MTTRTPAVVPRPQDPRGALRDAGRVRARWGRDIPGGCEVRHRDRAAADVTVMPIHIGFARPYGIRLGEGPSGGGGPTLPRPLLLRHNIDAVSDVIFATVLPVRGIGPERPDSVVLPLRRPAIAALARQSC